MSDVVNVVVCEVRKPPYRAAMTFDQIEEVIGDTVELIRPTAQVAWGHECPLPAAAAILAGGNARLRPDAPPLNRFGVLGNLVISGNRGHSLRRDLIERVIELVEQYDSDQLGRSFLFPAQAIFAPVWQRKGSEWSPDAHLTGPTDRPEEFRFINALLRKYAVYIVAFYDARPLPKLYSVELQFADDKEGREQARSFVREYESGFNANGRLKKSAREASERAIQQQQVRP
jgi:hypothetical protein